MPRLFLLLWLMLMALADVSPALGQAGPAARAKMSGRRYVHRPFYRLYRGGGRRARRKRTARYRRHWYQFWRRRHRNQTPTPRPPRNQTIGTGQP